ncbi:peptidylprolyl isomerase [Pleionea sp. CnH1-48]|nr:peptidylprolyl isomerase [Pleionea sp. CnH1-48]
MKTNYGDIDVRLYETKAPVTTKNFLHYVKSGFYDGTLFHRVVKDFVIQGGGYTKTKDYKETSPAIINEAKNGLRNLRGTLAMAREYEKDTATSQFFINLTDNQHLDHRSETNRGFGYSVFGKVIKGMEVVDKIAAIPTGASDPFDEEFPVYPVIIQKVTVKPTSSETK